MDRYSEFYDEVMNVDEIVDIINGEDHTPPEAHNGVLYPQHTGHQGGFRCLVTGKSGSGKSNVVLDLIMGVAANGEKKINFHHLYLVASSPDQGKYKALIKWVNSMEKAFEAETKEYCSMITVITEPEDMPPLEEVNKEIVNVMIIDDMIMKKNQRVFADWFVRSRHKSVSIFYLTQDFYQVPATIRKQCNYFITFEPDSASSLDHLARNLRLTHSKEEFYDMFEAATSDQNSFLLVDRRTTFPLLRFRKRWNEVWDSENHEFVPLDIMLSEENLE